MISFRMCKTSLWFTCTTYLIPPLVYHLFTRTLSLSLQQILIRTEKLLQSGTILETLKHTDHDTINTLMGKIKQLMTDFDDRLGKRKKKIDESVQLHKLTEMVRTLFAFKL